MSQYLLIERIKVQNANAASGFTWGFPAITHFLGFSHNLNRKLNSNSDLSNLALNGCMVVAHEQHAHSYKDGAITRFSQYKTAQYLSLKFDKGILKDPAINEEAKMNMTVSLLIPVDGYLGGLQDLLIAFIKNACQIQRLAGGTVLSVANVDIVDLANEEQLKSTRRKLLPGFILQDRSDFLSEHFSTIKESNPKAELLDAWFDFIALKQVARPACELLDKHLAKQAEKSALLSALNDIWLEHKSQPYQQENLPNEIITYFSEQQESINPKTLTQWQSYLEPTGKTSANWEYVKKPQQMGYLVPIMTGYKAITDVYAAGEIDGARDSVTDLCFVEAVHSVGEWQSVHRLKKQEQWQASVWNYATYEKGWYLCQQGVVTEFQELTNEPTSDEVYY
ncbi:type I-F CRISPR-associated protein Csy2 [Vibrio sp. 10N.286.49.B3]|uniref:type I-F CRISPR-associated protein Csy2 n=1 Tax=Vibrio sp. 10N.286.49.B3 TaxID=1880855 RepID=UPI000C82D2EB|nr:type I-F CRISPR-associated protein Csy2 [Vibrio sp. 10N.286.49.B3]PMH37114.1 type I-F CRISPR-associated protein Csy2 [Vibrio sp. 10N.286.49.B3]